MKFRSEWGQNYRLNSNAAATPIQVGPVGPVITIKADPVKAAFAVQGLITPIDVVASIVTALVAQPSWKVPDSFEEKK